MESQPVSPAIEALAEAWASIEGRLEEFRQNKAEPHSERAQKECFYIGYTIEAGKLARLLEERGFVIVERP